ncbi:MAG: CerR family C-terminal domain-containing protein [Woeseiaceae bacterium]|nr:CerR family C-terminal domain-containing protein [Woeseiaceae bacterium]
MTSTSSSPRGDTRREALIQAAVDIFGRDGFAATGTRAVADAAGVNQALIAYHFGGKSGLYLAAIDHIVDRVRERVDPLLADIDAELGDRDADTGPDRCLALLLQLLDTLVVVMTSEKSGTWARLVLKEQQDPSEGFELLYDGIQGRLIGLCTRLIGRIRGIDPDSETANLLALTLFGQVLIFRTGRATVERRTGWRQFTQREIAAVQAQIRRNATAILKQVSFE